MVKRPFSGIGLLLLLQLLLCVVGFTPILLYAQNSCVFVNPINQRSSSWDPDSPSMDDRAVSTRAPLLASRQLSQLSLPNFAPDFPNINVTQDSLDDQNEPSIAVDPRNPNAIVIGANDYRSDKVLWSYSSTDGGLTWLQQALPGYTLLATATDPGVQYDTKGTVYYSNGRADQGGFPAPRSEVVCYTSTNVGTDWSDPNIVVEDTVDPAHLLSDKFYLTIDRVSSSPHFGRVYVVWAEIANGFSRIAEAFSTDGGTSWSPKEYVSPANAQYQCPIPACEPNGDLLVTYIDLDSNSRRIVLGRSTDGGSSFGNQIMVAPFNSLGPIVPRTVNGHPVIKGALRVNSFPSIAVDLSNHVGRAYITWCAKGSDARDHVYLAASYDGGFSWSAPFAIENDVASLATDKFFPWISVDESNGDVGVVFYDSRNDPNDTLIDVYMSLSKDGGSSFSTRRISSSSFNPTLRLLTAGTLIFFGDYIGLAATEHRWYPAWTDSRSGEDQDIYMSTVRPYAPAAVTNLAALATQGMARISWQYAGQTTFGFPLGGYHFEVTRSDGSYSDSVAPSTFSILDGSVVPGNAYSYSVQVIADDGDSSARVTVDYNSSSGVAAALAQPLLSLDAAPSPNPAAQKAMQAIGFTLSKNARVTATVYNCLGQVVEELLHGKVLERGPYKLQIPTSGPGVYWLSVVVESSGVAQRELRKSVVL